MSKELHLGPMFAGFGNMLARPLFREKHSPDMSEAEATELMHEALKVSSASTQHPHVSKAKPVADLEPHTLFLKRFRRAFACMKDQQYSRLITLACSQSFIIHSRGLRKP